MKKFIGSFAIAFALVTALGSGVQAGTVIEDEFGVDCECNSSNQCVASGGGGDCHNGSKCWKSDLNCRGTSNPVEN